MLRGSLSSQHGESSVCGWREGLQIWRVAANILNKLPRTAGKGWSTSLGMGRGAKNPLNVKKRNLLRNVPKRFGPGLIP
jgi:hypothetical protein